MLLEGISFLFSARDLLAFETSLYIYIIIVIFNRSDSHLLLLIGNFYRIEAQCKRHKLMTSAYIIQAVMIVAA